MKEIKDISWQEPESEYRKDKALSYSTLATYERGGGFYSIPTLFDRKESKSLTLGSAVDSIITGGDKEFNERFIVFDINITDSGKSICNALASKYKIQYRHFDDIPEVIVSKVAQETGFWKDPKYDSRRYKEVLKTGDLTLYYDSLINTDKTLLSSDEYIDVLNMVSALRTSESTKFYFQQNDIFDVSVKRFYQLKFKATIFDVDYRCMADLIIQDDEHKTITPVDLKTSSHYEAEFYKSFIDWSYHIQARLYWRIIQQNMLQDEFFKNYTLNNYLFIVVNKNTLTPLVWEYPDTTKDGTLYYGRSMQIKCRSPFEIGSELDFYLKHPEQKIPLDISTSKNDIVDYLNKM